MKKAKEQNCPKNEYSGELQIPEKYTYIQKISILTS